MTISDCVRLNNGVQMPWLGLGVFKMKDGEETEAAIQAALDCGYRSIDTAAVYRNEVSVGRAILNSGLPRNDVFITTKVWNADQGYESTLTAFENSRERLQLDVIDLTISFTGP